MMRKLFLIFGLLLALALVGCGGSESSDSNSSLGDVANGQKLFNQSTIGSASGPGCVTCHSTEPGQVIVGPSQFGLADRAAERVSGLTAEAYLRQSITDPNKYLVEGFAEGLMYQTYATELTPTEINDLVAYLMTLKSE